jgi:hypothetical protein
MRAKLFMNTSSDGPVLRAATSASPRDSARMRVWALSLAAATLAGLLAWASAERLTPFFAIPEPIWDPQDRVHFGRAFAQFVAATRDAALAWGITGGLVGLALGVAGATAAAWRRVLPAAMAGAVLGAVLGASPTLAAFPAYWGYRMRHSPEDQLWLSLATHATAWSGVGLAGGFALGLGLGGPGRAAQGASGGLAGAALAVLAYEILGAFVLPYDAVASKPVPNAAYARLIASLLVAAGAASGATLAATSAPAPAPPPSPPPASGRGAGDGEEGLAVQPSGPEASRTTSPAPASGNFIDREGLPTGPGDLTDQRASKG